MLTKRIIRTLQRVVDNSDIVFHLAANPDVMIGAEDTRIDFQQNVQATYNLLEAIRKSQAALEKDNKNNSENRHNRKRLIFTSSSTVYGEANKMPTPRELYSSTSHIFVWCD